MTQFASLLGVINNSCKPIGTDVSRVSRVSTQGRSMAIYGSEYTKQYYTINSKASAFSLEKPIKMPIISSNNTPPASSLSSEKGYSAPRGVTRFWALSNSPAFLQTFKQTRFF